uniref:Uncharacterized protein n=1 Tax=Fagus sylvatica TaxID=28930 RepID=A0A2N9FT47_FAGSY
MQTHQKSSTNPLQTATVEIAKREGVCAHLASRFPLPSPPHSLTFVVAAQLTSPLLHRHRLAAPHSATPHVDFSSALVLLVASSTIIWRESEREREQNV